jgi:hypothetical protein
MDALAAAAMDVDGIAGGDFGQREAPVAAATVHDELQLPASEAMDEDKEINGAHAAACEAEDAASKVSKAPRAPSDMRRVSIHHVSARTSA